MSIKFVPITVKEPKVTSASITADIVAAMKALGNRIASDLLAPTSTWENKPSFKVDSSANQAQIQMDVLLNGASEGNKEYEWVDDGTPKHDVSSGEKHSKLPMPGTFTAKTVPGTFAANAGSEGTDRFTPVGYPLEVEVKPRGFTEAVATEWEEAFPNSMVRKINEIGDELI